MGRTRTHKAVDRDSITVVVNTKGTVEEGTVSKAHTGSKDTGTLPLSLSQEQLRQG